MAHCPHRAQTGQVHARHAKARAGTLRPQVRGLSALSPARPLQVALSRPPTCLSWPPADLLAPTRPPAVSRPHAHRLVPTRLPSRAHTPIVSCPHACRLAPTRPLLPSRPSTCLFAGPPTRLFVCPRTPIRTPSCPQPLSHALCRPCTRSAGWLPTRPCDRPRDRPLVHAPTCPPIYLPVDPCKSSLIDKIKKASREFVVLFLQVLVDGRLTDPGQSRVVDFRNTIIIMTIDLCATFLHGMGDSPARPETRELALGAIRVHSPCPPSSSTGSTASSSAALSEDCPQDCRPPASGGAGRPRGGQDGRRPRPRREAGPRLDRVSTRVRSHPLTRVIQSEVLDPLSMVILGDRVHEGETVEAPFDGPQNRLQIVPTHKASADNTDVDYDDIEYIEMRDMNVYTS
ncbi:uncharacterized protein B0H18DRAFT_271836 [Fomitopsis serialis]|uniref:uncharacterized protein n=1 Tax=Fomitopsis serialis TaxID=139415 RepID=UPI0020076474|nr:uncharacterized protein B0H18DRAFT_271836 [Neoantrodia serialis]KAH9927724.1 hypothetical protein B0H18DRAFT_271836 [Neoantrodia serialis]